MTEIGQVLDGVYEAMEGSEVAEEYAARHGIESAAILTNYDDENCHLIAEFLRDRIEGKTVVEIGGGIGLLAFHLSTYAKRVFVIEASPAWSWAFTVLLYRDKPRNVSFLFGAASEFEGIVRADVAVFCTHSGVASMRAASKLFSENVIDVYRECAPEITAKWESYREMTRQQSRENESRAK